MRSQVAAGFFSGRLLTAGHFGSLEAKYQMVQLVVTEHLKTSLDALADVRRDGAQLPLELLEAIQTHLDAKQAWVEHKLLARISRWNKSSPCRSRLAGQMLQRLS
jgi:hypothetical protein